jgi:hypothetical protein
MIRTLKGVGIAILFCTTISVFAQGTVLFNNRNTALGLDAKVGYYNLDAPWNPFYDPALPAFFLLEGTNWTAQLWAANGSNPFESALAPASPTTTFRTGSGAGYVIPVTATLVGVLKDAASATIQMRVWNNRNGIVITWEQALADPTIPRAASAAFTVSSIGGDFNTPPPLLGLQAFNVAPIPEPSVLALMISGIGALFLANGRRKQHHKTITVP